MRTLLTIVLLTTLLCTKAQSHLQFPPITPYPLPDSGDLNHKWQLKPYASLSAGYIFLNGGTSFMSAPVGLLLLHPLNKNVSAFAGLSAAPTFFSMSSLYTAPIKNLSYPNHYGLGLSSRIEGGLIYTNDARTFSISGSIGVERGSYPIYPYTRTNTKKQ